MFVLLLVLMFTRTDQFYNEQATAFQFFESLKASRKDINKTLVERARRRNHHIAQLGNAQTNGNCFYSSVSLSLAKLGLLGPLTTKDLRREIVDHTQRLYDE